MVIPAALRVAAVCGDVIVQALHCILASSELGWRELNFV